MIFKTGDPVEIQGRLRVLSKVAYLYEQCRNWDKARGVYYAFVSSIEEGEATWNSSLGHYDVMCPAPVEIRGGDSRGDPRNPSSSKNRSAKRDFFCREYQKGECNQNPPHRAWVRNNFEIVEHYCSACARAKMGKLSHTPGSDSCSQPK